MIAAVAEKSVNQMFRVVAIIHGAFYVNLADNKHKHTARQPDRPTEKANS